MFNYKALPPKTSVNTICPYCMSSKVYLDPSCDKSKNCDDMEISYMKKMYPPLCKKIQACVNKELREYDHELSPIYEMYPSKETIDYIANSVYSKIKATNPNILRSIQENSLYTLIYIILLNEMYRKRMQKRLYR